MRMWPLDLSSPAPLNPVNEYLVNFSWFTAYETVYLGFFENVGSITILFDSTEDRLPLPYLRSLMQSLRWSFLGHFTFKGFKHGCGTPAAHNLYGVYEQML